FGDPDHGVMWEAAKALQILGSKRALRPLVQALEGAPEAARRSAAAYALGGADDARAIEPLLRTLGNRADAPGVRGHAAEALSSLWRYVDGLPAPLSRALVDTLIEGLRDPSVEARFWCCFAFIAVKAPEALPELERLAATDHAVLPGWWAV